MSELKDFIRQRFTDLDRRAAPLMARQEELREELSKIDREVASLNAELDEVLRAGEALNINLEVLRIGEFGRTGNEPTIKQAVRLVLAEFLAGLNSSDLLSQCNLHFFSGRLDRTSFSPQLSRMKRDEEVTLVDGLYLLTDYGRSLDRPTPRARTRTRIPVSENELSDVPASDSSDAGSDQSSSGQSHPLHTAS